MFNRAVNNLVSRQASELFDNVEEQLEYMEEHGFGLARAHVLEHHGRYDRAAEVAFHGNDVVEGIRLLLCSDNAKSIRQAVDRALRALWTMLPFGTYGNKLENSAIGSLIQHLKGADMRILDRNDTHQASTLKRYKWSANQSHLFFSLKYFKHFMRRNWIAR